MSNFNPACYLPTAISQRLPSLISCPPPPSYFSTAYSALTSPFSSTYTLLRTMMDALIGLPFLSFLLIPTMTSYSTSLNLLFFYLTWSTLVLSHPALRVELVATLAVRILFYILPSLFFILFDYLLPSTAESLKAQGSAALPLKRASRRAALRHLRILSFSLLNTLFALALQTAIELLLTRVLLVRSALRVTTTLPMPLGILKDLVRGYLAREVLTYAIHRYVLHENASPLSNWHNKWYHDIAAPFPLAASYDHPLAFLLRSFLPTYLPALFFRFHLLTYILYLALISVEETFAYSGYSTVPTNFILGGIARRTDAHVTCGGEGNYGCWGMMDWIMGTSVGGDLGDDVELEAEKHDVRGKVDRAKGRVGDGVRRKVNGAVARVGGGRTRSRS